MNAWELPTALTVNGIVYQIRTDYTVILDILRAVDAPDLFEPDASEDEKKIIRCEVLLKILYIDFESLPTSDWNEAVKKAVEFIDCGMDEKDDRKKPKTMDWEQDAPYMIPAISKALGVQDIRMIPHLHWWTFVGAYMNIGDCLFSQVLHVRQKKSKDKKLEKWEKEFYESNREIIDIKQKLSEEEKIEREKEEQEWNKFFKDWGG